MAGRPARRSRGKRPARAKARRADGPGQARAWSLLQATLNATADGILVVDLDGNLVTHNRRFTEMWRLPTPLARTREARLRTVLAQLCDPQGFEVRLRALFADPKAERYDLLHLKDGRIFERYSQPQRIAGQIIGRVISCRDVTERTRAQAAAERAHEELRDALAWREAVVEGSRDAIFMSDSSAQFVAVNRAACELTGYRHDELLRMRIPDLHDEADLGAYRRYHPRILHGEEIVTEARIQRRDGTKVDVEFNNRRIAIGGAWYVHTVARDVTERKRVDEQLQRSRRLLRKLAQRLRDAHEEERARLARELHDQIGQALTAIKLHLETLGRTGDAGLKGPLGEGIRLVDRALQDVRTLSFELRPAMLDDLGLTAALSSYARRQAEAARLELHLVAPPLGERPPKEVETACFRIAQEAITNVVRHARARRLEIELQSKDHMLELRVRDDGAGFVAHGLASEAWDLGLVGMEERAVAAGGALDIESHHGRGTTVHAYFPLPARPAAP